MNLEHLVCIKSLTFPFDESTLMNNTKKILEEGTPMTMTNLTVHVLSNGDQYNIKERQVKVLPMEAPFI